MHKHWIKGLGVAALGFSLAASAQMGTTDKAKEPTAKPAPAASDTSAKSTATPAKADAKTEKLLKDLGHGDQLEIMGAKMAQEKTQNDKVKDYAKKLETDHTAHWNELKSLAATWNVKIDEMASREHEMGEKDEQSAMGGSGEAEESAKHEQMESKGEEMSEMHGEMAKDPAMKKHLKAMKALEAKSGAEFDKGYVKMMVEDHTEDIAKVKKARKDVKKNPELATFLEKTQTTFEEHLKIAKDLQKELASSTGAKHTAR